MTTKLLENLDAVIIPGNIRLPWPINRLFCFTCYDIIRWLKAFDGVSIHARHAFHI